MSRLNGRLAELERVLPPDGLTPLQRRRLERQRQAPPPNWDVLTPEELARADELAQKCRRVSPGRWDFTAISDRELDELVLLIEKVEGLV